VYSPKAVEKAICDFIRDEDGQSTTEYVLLLVVLAVAIIAVMATFKSKVIALLEGRIRGHILNALTSQVFKCSNVICGFR
jgi:Flp pilus assembly pilin Flp